MSGDSDPELDPRIHPAMDRQLAVRQLLVEGGAGAVGWKVGYGAPAARSRLELAHPLVGFLTGKTQLQPGTTFDGSLLGDLRVELEVAVHFGADVDGDPGAAVSGLGAALELVDFADLDDVGAILEGNIYHRGFVLAPPVNGLGLHDLDSIQGELLVNGEAVAAAADVQAATGRLGWVLSQVVRTLSEFGLTLRAGEVVMCGSVVPLHPVRAGQTVEGRLGRLGTLGLTIA